MATSAALLINRHSLLAHFERATAARDVNNRVMTQIGRAARESTALPPPPPSSLVGPQLWTRTQHPEPSVATHKCSNWKTINASAPHSHTVDSVFVPLATCAPTDYLLDSHLSAVNAHPLTRVDPKT